MIALNAWPMDLPFSAKYQTNALLLLLISLSACHHLRVVYMPQ